MDSRRTLGIGCMQLLVEETQPSLSGVFAPQQQNACMRHSGPPADFPGRREVKCKEMCPRGKERVSVALPWRGLMKNEFGILGVTTARSD